MHLYFHFSYTFKYASGVRIWGYYQIHSKKSIKTRQNTPYGGETLCYSLLQGGVTNSKLEFGLRYIGSTDFSLKNQNTL